MHTVFGLKRKVHSSKEAFLHQYKVMQLCTYVCAAQGLLKDCLCHPRKQCSWLVM